MSTPKIQTIYHRIIFIILFTGLVFIGGSIEAYAADGATFVSETILDGTQIGAGQSFTKSWTIRNSGTTTWNSGYRLRWVSGASLSNHADVVVAGSVAPGSSYTFIVPMTASTSGGTYREDWKLINGSGSTILVSGSSTIWVIINVTAALPGAPTPLSPGAAAEPGLTISTTTPTFQWSGVSGADGYGLYISQRDGSGNYNLIFDSEIRYGGPITGSSLVLPSGVLTNGGQYRWNMRSHSSAGWGTAFSGRLYFSVSGPTDGATFVSETILDGTQVGAGQSFTKSWTIRNSGTTTWNSGYRLRWVSGANLSNHADVVVAGSVAPGSSYTFIVPMTAPGSGGTYREDWKLINGSGSTILVSGSSTVWVIINVPSSTLADGAAFVSETILDGTTLSAGQAFSKTWTIRNSGTTTWNSGYRLRWVSGANLSNHADVLVAGTVAPGSNYTFSKPMTAPASGGTYREDWKLINGSGSTILVGNSSTIWVSISVRTTASQVPVASFTHSPASPIAGQSVQFNGSATGATPISWTWDLNADGITDTTAQSPTHVFQNPGTYRVSLTARNAYGSDSYSQDITVAAPASSGTPVITRVNRQYPNFVRGSYDNRFDVSVDWNGSPGTLSFSINGGTPIIENGSAAGGSHVFHMGSDFAPGNSAAVVTITARNAAGLSSSPFSEYVYVYPYPAYFNDALQGNYGTLNFTANGSELRAIFRSDFPNPHLNQNGRIYIPSYIPYLGGDEFGFLETYAKQSLDISSTGRRSASVEAQTGFTMAGRSFLVNGSGSGTLDLSPPRGLTLTSASLKLSLRAEHKEEVSLLEFLPGYGRALAELRDFPGIGSTLTWFYNVAKAEGTVRVAMDDFIVRWAQDSSGQLRFSDGSGTVRFGADGFLRNQLSKRTYVQTNVWGEGTIKLGVPAPFTREVSLLIGIGSEVSLDYLFGVYVDNSKAYYKCTWLAGRSEADCHFGVPSKSAQLSASLTSASGSLSLIRPNYERFGKYSVFQPETRLTSLSSETFVSAKETTFLNNVFPGASPALIEVGNGQFLLWKHQDVTLPVLQSTDIAWSYNNGGGWSAPALIADDTRAELSPVAGVDANGKVVAAWIRVKDLAFSTPINTFDDLPLFYTRHEVVSSVFDPSARTWGPVMQLTDDVALDASLQLSSDKTGRLLLSWLSNQDGKFTSTASSPSTLKYSFWNGSTWAAPAIVASSLTGVSIHTSAVSGTNAFVIIPRDPDPSVTSDGVLNLYTWNGSGWSSGSTFADGGVENRLPAVAYDSVGQGHVVWVRNGNLVHATLSDPTPQVIRANSTSQAFYDAQLLTNPQGNLTLVRQEIAENGPANLFATLFDPASQTWSEDRQLNVDPWMVHDVAGFYGRDGLLHAAYLNTEITRTAETVLFDGQSETISNVPQNGQTNLRLFDRSLIVDLSVGNADLTVIPLVPQSGETVTATLDVHNAGDFAASNFVVNLYAGAPGAGGIVVGSQTVTAALRAGDHRLLTFSFVYPASGGNLVAVIDALNSIVELSESNNRATLYLTNTAPQANLAANVTSGGAPSTVMFDASGSLDAEGDALFFAWTFADGSQSASGDKVSHTFNQPGVYPVTVVVTDSHGAVSTASVTITVTAQCTFTLAAQNISIPAAGGMGSVSFTASASDCAWSAASNADWLTITSSATGVGNGTISYSVAANTGQLLRIATLTVAGQVFTVAQDGAQPSGIVQFNQSNYSFSEGQLFANITVTRSGDSSAPATVKYSTSDTADVNFRCDPGTTGQPTGVASRKCDYHIAAGTLRFAPGETTKQFTLSLVNDIYVEGPETFTLSLSSPVGVTLGPNNAVPVLITDDDASVSANPIDNTRFFVRQLYVDLLSREPDLSGWNGWTTRIDQCGQPGQPPPPCNRVTVGGDGFLRSGEFFDRQFFVLRLYRTGLGRILRYDEVGDLAYVSGFLTADQLELNKQDLTAEIVSRAEFVNRYNPLSNAAFVATLMQTAGIAVPQNVQDGWVTALNSNAKTRAQVFREISERPEVSSRYLHEAQVVSAYYGFFTRNPDGAYLNYLQRLDSGEITLSDLANAFINAQEYRQRFGQ